MSEERLGARLINSEEPITKSDRRIRIAFWREHANSMESNRPMYISYVLEGVASEANWDRFVRSPIRVAWLLHKPMTYQETLLEALDFGVTKLRSMLDLPDYDNITLKNGRTKKVLNPKILEIKMKIIQMIDQRVNGAYLQRTESKQMNINMSGKEAKLVEGTKKSFEELNARIKELEKTSGGVGLLPPPDNSGSPEETN
jgi:hypothetical protein